MSEAIDQRITEQYEEIASLKARIAQVEAEKALMLRFIDAMDMDREWFFYRKLEGVERD